MQKRVSEKKNLLERKRYRANGWTIKCIIRNTFTAGEPYGQFTTLPSLRVPQMSYIAQ